MPAALDSRDSLRSSLNRVQGGGEYAAGSLSGVYRFDPWASAGMDLQSNDHWLLSYVDILTLLLTLLVVLLVLQPESAAESPVTTHGIMEDVRVPLVLESQVRRVHVRPIRREPQRAVAEAVLETLPEVAPEGSPEVVVPRNELALLSPSPASKVLTGIPSRTLSEPTTVAAETVVEDKQLATQGDQQPTVERDAPLLKRLLAERLDERLKVTRVAGGVNLEMRDNVLFGPGSAELRLEGKRLLAGLARVLLKGQGGLSVEGHTDDRPIANSRFPSNWELSTGRASAVSRYLISQGLAASRLRVVGYASTRPLTSNATPAGRALNRRVSLVVQLQLQQEQVEPAP